MEQFQLMARDSAANSMHTRDKRMFFLFDGIPLLFTDFAHNNPEFGKILPLKQNLFDSVLRFHVNLVYFKNVFYCYRDFRGHKPIPFDTF